MKLAAEKARSGGRKIATEIKMVRVVVKLIGQSIGLAGGDLIRGVVNCRSSVMVDLQDWPGRFMCVSSQRGEAVRLGLRVGCCCCS